MLRRGSGSVSAARRSSMWIGSLCAGCADDCSKCAILRSNRRRALCLLCVASASTCAKCPPIAGSTRSVSVGRVRSAATSSESMFATSSEPSAEGAASTGLCVRAKVVGVWLMSETPIRNRQKPVLGGTGRSVVFERRVGDACLVFWANCPMHLLTVIKFFSLNDQRFVLFIRENSPSSMSFQKKSHAQDGFACRAHRPKLHLLPTPPA